LLAAELFKTDLIECAKRTHDISSSAFGFFLGSAHLADLSAIARQPVRADERPQGSDIQAKPHRHVEDPEIRYPWIKRGTSQFKGKVERSHQSDQPEFYQHIGFTPSHIGFKRYSKRLLETSTTLRRFG
jgi:hypothetical protein